MSKKNNFKNRVGVVYSTSDDFEYEEGLDHEEETLPAGDQKLKVILDTKNRKGKKATVVTGFVGSSDDLDDLGKLLKKKCGVGGNAKDGEVIIQGDLREKVVEILLKEGYKAKKV